MLLFLINVWSVVLDLAPWLLIGLFIAGVLHLFVPDSFVVRHLGKQGGVLSVFKAVILGVPMPLCSCGVIPAALGIKKQGAGNGAATGFLISTPQTGIDSIMVSASMLGIPFALFKVVSAFVTGIVGGVIVHATDGSDHNQALAAQDQTAPDRSLKELYNFSVNDLLKTVWRWLLGGVIASAALTTWLPDQFLSETPLGSPFLAMLVMLIISLPLYVCATASVPIAAALVQAGMPAGAALVFLMAGPASNITTLGAVYKSLGLKNLLIYLGTIVVGSFGFGYLFDFVISEPATVADHCSVDHSGILTRLSGVLFFCLLFKFAVEDCIVFIKKFSGSSREHLFTVEGMTCKGCAGKLIPPINQLPGVTNVTIDVEKGQVCVYGDAINNAAVEEVIELCGFKVVRPKQNSCCCGCN